MFNTHYFDPSMLVIILPLLLFKFFFSFIHLFCVNPHVSVACHFPSVMPQFPICGTIKYFNHIFLTIIQCIWLKKTLHDHFYALSENFVFSLCCLLFFTSQLLVIFTHQIKTQLCKHKVVFLHDLCLTKQTNSNLLTQMFVCVPVRDTQTRQLQRNWKSQLSSSRPALTFHFMHVDLGRRTRRATYNRYGPCTPQKTYLSRLRTSSLYL